MLSHRFLALAKHRAVFWMGDFPLSGAYGWLSSSHTMSSRASSKRRREFSSLCVILGAGVELSSPSGHILLGRTSHLTPSSMQGARKCNVCAQESREILGEHTQRWVCNRNLVTSSACSVFFHPDFWVLLPLLRITDLSALNPSSMQDEKEHNLVKPNHTEV